MKNRKLQKMLGGVAAATMLIPMITGAMGAGQIASAAKVSEKPANISVTINKQLFGSMPDELQNTGLEMTEFTGKPLKDAVFTMYEVTAQYYEYLAANPTKESEDAIADLAQRGESGGFGTRVGSGQTSKDGEATFVGVDTYDEANKRDRIYMFIETYAPSIVSKKSAPIILAMPVMYPEVGEDGKIVLDENGKIKLTNDFNDDVELYAKNEDSEFKKDLNDFKGVEVDVLDKNQNPVMVDEDGKLWYSKDEGYVSDLNAETPDEYTGDVSKLKAYKVDVHDTEKDKELNYTIKSNIPLNIKDMRTDTPSLPVISKYEIVDTPSDNLEYIENSLEVILPDGSPLGVGLYTVTKEGNGFKLVFDVNNLHLRTALDAHAGSELVVNYKMSLTTGALADVEHDNEAKITIESQHEEFTADDNGPTVVTGGKNFLKLDAQTNKPLPDATFVLTDGAGTNLKYAQFYTYVGGTKTPVTDYTGSTVIAGVEWVANKSAATEITSDSKGEFSVAGLEYTVQGEVDPTDPIDPDEPTDHNYHVVEIAAPNGYVTNGEPIPFTVGFGSSNENITIKTEVMNTKKGVLPSTGGTGIFAFLAVGTALMMGAYLWFKNSKKQEV